MFFSKKIRIGNTLVTFLLILLLIASFYSNGLFGYLDELVACISILIIFILIIIGKFKKSSLSIVLVLMLLITEGIISNLFGGVNVPYTSIFIDILTLSKPIIIFIATIQIVSSDYFTNIKNKLNYPIKIFIIILLGFFIINQLGVINMSDDSLGIIRNFKFTFNFSGAFGLFLFSLIPFINGKHKKLYQLISFFMMIFTFKSQIIFFIVLFISLKLLEKHSKKNIKSGQIILLLVISLIIVFPAINTYFLTMDYSPRKVLLDDAFKLLKIHFPFGTGFSTFGSPMAAKIYSPLYVKYGYYQFFGMGTDGYNQFLSDNYLSAIIGQFGISGIILFLILNFLILNKIFKRKINMNEKIYCIAVVISLVATILASSYYTSAPGALLMLIVGIIIGSVKT